jgi:hypothetical protein
MKIKPHIVGSIIVAAMLIGVELGSIVRPPSATAQATGPNSMSVGRYQYVSPYVIDTATGQLFSFNGAVVPPTSGWARLGSPANAN